MSARKVVELHLVPVAAIAAIRESGVNSQSMLNKVGGALMGIQFMDIREAGHFDELARGLTAEMDKFKMTGNQKIAGGFISNAVILVQEMKKEFRERNSVTLKSSGGDVSRAA